MDTHTETNSLAGRLADVRERMEKAARRAGRDPQSVRLVVVTKGHPVETARLAVRAGATDLGENYPLDAIPRIEALQGEGVAWHMIGHVQSRKARLVAENFDLVHSLDSVKLARRLDKARAGDEPLPVLMQVNVSGEESKFGLPAWAPGQEAGLLAFIEDVRPLPSLRLCGLMTVPPFLPAEAVRPFFKRLRDLRDSLERHLPGLPLPELSMGMSADFEVAIEEGATIVRVGTAILGPR